MKNYLPVIAMLGTVVGFAATTLPTAHAADLFSFSFNTGNVAFAYSDGYWDNGHQWHSWRNAREAREYRAHYSANYKNSRHTKEQNKGWRGDQDHDGVPNARDRDRDGDGVSNQHDTAPNNPRRN